jgi:hypothetical protein
MADLGANEVGSTARDMRSHDVLRAGRRDVSSKMGVKI